MNSYIFIAIFMAGCVNAGLLDDPNSLFQRQMDQMNRRFANFPKFPKLQFTMPAFPPMPQIPILTPEDIANHKPGPGENYNGIAVSSHVSSVVNDGKVEEQGGGIMVSNVNGVTKTVQFGDPISADSQGKSGKWQPNQIWQPLNDVNTLNIKIFKPENNEHFIGRSAMSVSQFSNINGFKSLGGISNMIYNMDGDVTGEVVEVSRND